jgi:hypothetical protein
MLSEDEEVGSGQLAVGSGQLAVGKGKESAEVVC